MDAQPLKRRKTSPSKATPVFTPLSERAASRASFMSPTHASLSRFNPSLLPSARAASTGPIRRTAADSSSRNGLPQQTPQTEAMARGHEALNFVMGGFNEVIQNAMAAAQSYINSPSVAQSPLVPLVATGDETDEQMEAMRAAIRSRKAQGQRYATPRILYEAHGAPDDEVDELSPDVQRASGRQSTLRKTNAGIRSRNSTPRATSETYTVDAEDTDELSPDVSRKERLPRRTSSARLSVDSSIQQVYEDQNHRETPSIQDQIEDDLSLDVPRATNGRVERIATEEPDLPETPEALRRQLELDDHPPRGILFSSPSKRRRTQAKTQAIVEITTLRTVPQQSVVSEKPAVPEKPMVQSVEGPVVEFPSGPNPVATKDPDLLAKEAEKARLERELRMLQAEVDQYEHFAQLYSSDTEVSSHNFQDMLKLIATSRPKAPADQDGQTLSSLLTSFLPFSIPLAKPPTPPTTPDQQKPFISHEPLKETDPLPMNTLFTPLSITSTVHAPTGLSSSPDRIVQKHSITLASPGSLLSCALDLSISSEPSSASEPSIESLELSDLTSWVEPNVKSWLLDRCKEGDIVAVGYGLGRYWDVAVKRAQCWIQCEKDFPHLAPGSASSGKDGPRTNGEGETNLDPSGQTTLSKQRLLPHLGRQKFLFESSDVILQLSWALKCDWTGDVESHITAEAAVPETWRRADPNNALHKIPLTFDTLLRERGVMQAVKVTAGLLFDAP